MNQYVLGHLRRVKCCQVSCSGLRSIHICFRSNDKVFVIGGKSRVVESRAYRPQKAQRIKTPKTRHVNMRFLTKGYMDTNIIYIVDTRQITLNQKGTGNRPFKCKWHPQVASLIGCDCDNHHCIWSQSPETPGL